MAELWKGSMDSFAPIPPSVTEDVSTHVKDKIIYVDSQLPRGLRNCNIARMEGKGIGELNQMFCLILLLLWLLNLQDGDVMEWGAVVSPAFCSQKQCQLLGENTSQFSTAMTYYSQVPQTVCCWMNCGYIWTLFSCKTASSENEILALSTKIMCTSAVLSETGSPY